MGVVQFWRERREGMLCSEKEVLRPSSRTGPVYLDGR